MNPGVFRQCPSDCCDFEVPIERGNPQRGGDSGGGCRHRRPARGARVEGWHRGRAVLTEFLRSLNRRGLWRSATATRASRRLSQGSSGHLAALPVHFMRNALARRQDAARIVSAAIGTVFVQESADATREWRSVINCVAVPVGRHADARGRERRARFHDVPAGALTQIYSTNPPSDSTPRSAAHQRRGHPTSIHRQTAGARMLEQNDEWSLNRRYVQLGACRRSAILFLLAVRCGSPSTAHLDPPGLWTDTMRRTRPIGLRSRSGLLSRNPEQLADKLVSASLPRPVTRWERADPVSIVSPNPFCPARTRQHGPDPSIGLGRRGAPVIPAAAPACRFCSALLPLPRRPGMSPLCQTHIAVEQLEA
jgi:hypothetical protein